MSSMKIKALAPWFGDGKESRIHKKPISGCWEWQRARNEKGYGVCCIKRKMYKAHRLSYEIHIGPIPVGASLLHSCDNPCCCNPLHLHPGTKAENNRDIVKRGRHVPGGTKTPKLLCKYERGEGHHAAKFTAEQIRSIRDRYASGECTQQKLASQYGTSRDAIGKIVRRERWAHVK